LDKSRIERGVAIPVPTSANDSFKLANAVKFVPKFDDSQMDQYLLAFEKAMLVLNFPKDRWTQLIQTQLTGKALKVFSELTVEQCLDYDTLKRALLLAYARVPEFHRKRFRSLTKGSAESYSNFAFRLSLPFKSWMEGEEAFDSLAQMREVIKLEQFVNCLPVEIHRWVVEKHPKLLVDAAKLADEYAVLYNPFKMEQGQSQKLENVPTHVVQNNRGNFSSQTRGRGQASPRGSFNRFPSIVRCGKCGRAGHIAPYCRTFPNTSSNFRADNDTTIQLEQQPKPVCLCNDRVSEVEERYAPYCATATLVTDEGVRKPVVFLRDSGAMQSLISKEYLQKGDYSDICENRLIQGVLGGPTEIPLVEINLENDRVKGKFLCGMVDSLPNGVDLLVGNDLQQIMPLQICVVTRSGTDTTNNNAVVLSPDNDQSDVVEVLSEDSDHSPDTNSMVSDDDLRPDDNFHIAAEHNTSSSDEVDLSMLFNDNPTLLSVDNFVTRDELIALQRNDTELRKFFELAKADHSNNSTSYFDLRNDVLIRRGKDRISPSGLETSQIVVPRQLHTKLLRVSHDIPTAGHLGVRKTYDRLARHFFWVGMHKDVALYCRTCNVCQRLGKADKHQRAPLINLPVIGNIFSKIAVDIVGPLKKCKSGNRFILTVIDLASHYPLAFPLQTHTAAEVVKCLIQVFSNYGFPDELLSDCGSEFMSELTQIFLTECQVFQLKTSPYHPQTNGCLERFHRTLKSMLKGCGETFPGDWDQLLPWVLFSYREVPVENLGFSPFELVFGRNVKGILQLIKNSWLHDDMLASHKSQNIIDFVLDLREKIRTSLALANEMEEKGKGISKSFYDKKAREISYEVGEQVLLLLPLIGKPLQAKYSGPYTVERRLGEVDYVISTPDRRKTRRVVHVNLMKRFIPRNVPLLPVASVLSCSDVPNKFVSVSMDHLQLQQRDDLTSLLDAYRTIFDDKPGRTTIVQHRISLLPDARPVRLAPYRMSPDKMRCVDAEILALLEDGVIEECTSAWAAPILVVPKPDGTGRLCVDFRRLNALTEPDPFPMPRIDALLDRLGGVTFMTKLDMTKAYFQVPIDPAHVPLTGFVTPHGHYQWRYMAFGLRNAPATFSRLVTKVFKGLENFCEAYLDDVMVFSKSWLNHVEHLGQVFERVREANLTLNLRKCEFANAKLDFLGHSLSLNTVQPRQQKVNALLSFPPPRNKKQVQSLLGLAGYYRKFLPHYADLTLPLTKLLKNNVPFKWSAEANNAFLDLKSRLATRPILRPPDYDLPFSVAVDASDTCVGAVLFQVVDGTEHPICFLSRKLRSSELNYATVEKEALALITAVRAFSVYFGAQMVTVYTDHSPLQYLQTMRNHNAKLTRWWIELQQYSITIHHRAGKDNILPDLLSRPSTIDASRSVFVGHPMSSLEIRRSVAKCPSHSPTLASRVGLVADLGQTKVL
jgi:transposase InsO family protein